MTKDLWDVSIVGGSAAGLVAAITCGRAGLRVLLLDGREKIGAKILMSGGTRCNLTNVRVSEDDFHSETKRTVRQVLSAFPSEKAVAFFKEIGVDVILEPGGKFFPSTHSGKTVRDALLREIIQLGVQLKTGSKVTNIRRDENHFQILTASSNHIAKTAVLCTGGLSYPATGSDGTGYEIAKSFGHHLIPTSPSLVPLVTNDSDLKTLSGVSLPARLSFFYNGKRQIAYEGSFLFTHFGFSGPVVLNISRHWIRAYNTDCDMVIQANFLPAEREEDFKKSLIEEAKRNPKQLIKIFLSKFLPKRFVEVILKKSKIAEDTSLNQLNREEREVLIRAFFHFPLPVTGSLGYEKAEVTAGGVDLEELGPKTLESKLAPGL
ncbi:MAG: NAD(P)/FAD-dependent oxidoreductase, partial [Candidatus Omnitrophica bacterium]|nr:NAD(P)/FAD-dependent oxidoreductase [Candidatus Omnitrophota bacterium]